ncbi:UDP-N-acetylmuramate dehydrogenase [Actinomyces sp. B33]|uniref:UDP-N-acetylmuramate dehydrogenase n=1 Tax=Actinomyces sp. B33 TaxID=2942131 RepID=UPI00234257A0|nr:UDP-N-acetylmuramate dehydrogenase [Actinomyces sp. B33]MDC4233578.1 UDP-N-acetylmuramate dehydrogenase [Actinomyces sp. B33]
MNTTLADLTTLRVGGPIGERVRAESLDALVAAVRRADDAGAPLLVLGGGSNLLACDAPFDGLVVSDARHDIDASDADGGRVLVTASAGTPWDLLVSWALDRGLSGLEALSGIPGTVGAAPVQNVGAYGHEVADTLVSVRAWDRLERRLVALSRADLGLGYRTSIIKRSTGHGGALVPEGGASWGPTGRWVVLDASFLLDRSGRSAPVMYRELATRLGIEVGRSADARLVRETVLALRRSKGMVLDAADHDTWSAGSFFTNPILDEAGAARLPEDAPRFPLGGGDVKTSAAWLIERAGFSRGWSLPGSAASLSTKHVLALTNRGGASAADVVDLARAVRAGVEERFGVRLVPEPVGVGVDWG